MIILFQFEKCPDCIKVRHCLTELAIDYVSVNAPKGHPEKDQVMEKLFGSAKVPALWDTTTGKLVQGSQGCLDYLDKVYRMAEAIME